MNSKWNGGIFRVRVLKFAACGVALAMLSGHPVHAHDRHEHHAVASPQGKGYVRTLAAYKIPEVKLVDSDGKESLLAEAIRPDKPVMLNFIFTSCTAICPTMSAAFAQVAQQLGVEREAMQLVSISVDPEQDTPAKLKEYARQFEAGPQWRLFTGTTGNSILAQRAFDAYRGDKMNHVPLTFIRGANSNQWVRIEGLASADDLLREQRSLAEK